MFSHTSIRLFQKNPRSYSKKIPPQPPISPEMEQNFIKTLSPDLQDLYRRGASGQADDYEIAKYMRSKMTQEEMNKILESSFFDDYMKGPQFKMPKSLDPDNFKKFNGSDQEVLGSTSRNRQSGESEGEEEEAGPKSDIDHKKLHEMMAKFQGDQQKFDRFNMSNLKLPNINRD